MRVVINLLGVLTDDCTPMLFWELECHMSFGDAHGCASESGWLITTCQEVGYVFEDLSHDI